MKKSVGIMGMLLMLFIAGSGCHRTQSDMKGEPDNVQMYKYGRAKNARQMHRMRKYAHFNQMAGMRNGMMGQGWMYGMRRGMGPGFRYGMRRGMCPGPMYGMGPGMGRMQMDSMGRGPMRPGMMWINSIPNLKDNQKKEIADLRQQQQTEMKKLRDDTMAKVKNLREANRAKIMSLLTDDQKKFVESNFRALNPGPAEKK